MVLVLASVPHILSDVGLAILVASALAFLARAARQPLILAYVATGVVLGPSVGFGVIEAPESVEAISSLGLILLLYLIGLEIDVKAIRRAGKAVILSGIAQAPLNLVLCLPVPLVLAATGVLGPLGDYGLLYLSFGLAVSSTLVVVKLLYDKSELDTLPGRITLGVLVFQDLWSILFLAVQPSLSAPEVGPLLVSLGWGVALFFDAFLAAHRRFESLRSRRRVRMGSLGVGAGYSLLMGMSIQHVAGPERTTAMGLHQAIYGIGMFAGPWLSGIFANALGLRPMFGITAVMCLVLGVLGTKMTAKPRS